MNRKLGVLMGLKQNTSTIFILISNLVWDWLLMQFSVATMIFIKSWSPQISCNVQLAKSKKDLIKPFIWFTQNRHIHSSASWGGWQGLEFCTLVRNFNSNTELFSTSKCHMREVGSSFWSRRTKWFRPTENDLSFWSTPVDNLEWLMLSTDSDLLLWFWYAFLAKCSCANYTNL